MLRTAWSIFATRAAHTTPAREDLALVSRGARQLRTAGSMPWTAWSTSATRVACMAQARKCFASMSRAEKTAAHYEPHAEDSTADSPSRCCSDDSCTKQPSWGLMAGGAETACADHKSNNVDGPVINLRALCKVASCERFSTWRLSRKQPSHYHHHGPFKDGLALTVRTNHSNGVHRNQSYRALENPSFQVKAGSHFKKDCGSKEFFIAPLPLTSAARRRRVRKNASAD